MNILINENEKLTSSVILKDNTVFKKLVIALETNDGYQKIVDFLAGILEYVLNKLTRTHR